MTHDLQDQPEEDNFEELHINQSADVFAINCTNMRLVRPSAINCNYELADFGLPSGVQDFLSQSISENTKRGYRVDREHFEATGRTIPTSSGDIASYIAEMAGHYAVATIERRLASLAKAHRALGFDDTCKSELVKSTLRGIRRTLGTKQRQAAAILRDDLFAMLDKLGDQRSKDIRDRAVLLVGFATAMRRSELASLNVEDSSGKQICVMRF